MIDRIKTLIDTVDCFTCPLFKTCYNDRDDIDQQAYCEEVKEWLNEQYI